MKLEEARIGAHALVFDLLGTAAQMADRRPDWLRSLKEILDALEAANLATIDPMAPNESRQFFQYGDTIVMAGDDIHDLVVLAMQIIMRLHERKVLVQAAIAGGGTFHLTSTADQKFEPHSDGRHRRCR